MFSWPPKSKSRSVTGYVLGSLQASWCSAGVDSSCYGCWTSFVYTGCSRPCRVDQCTVTHFWPSEAQAHACTCTTATAAKVWGAEPKLWHIMPLTLLFSRDQNNIPPNLHSTLSRVQKPARTRWDEREGNIRSPLGRRNTASGTQGLPNIPWQDREGAAPCSLTHWPWSCEAPKPGLGQGAWTSPHNFSKLLPPTPFQNPRSIDKHTQYVYSLPSFEGKTKWSIQFKKLSIKEAKWCRLQCKIKTTVEYCSQCRQAKKCQL